jgi:hypothetical protein
MRISRSVAFLHFWFSTNPIKHAGGISFKTIKSPKRPIQEISAMDELQLIFQKNFEVTAIDKYF